jgi:hypothetical protein
MVLKRDGAPAAEITRARDACVHAARTWHVFASIAGPTVVARGVRRITPAAGEPALPGTVPPLVPLKDPSGIALPAKKDDTWRAPIAPGYAEWIWRDNSSKDQVAGYALAALWLWDALRSDAAAPKDVVDALVTDLVRFVAERDITAHAYRGSHDGHRERGVEAVLQQRSRFSSLGAPRRRTIASVTTSKVVGATRTRGLYEAPPGRRVRSRIHETGRATDGV